MKVVAGIVGALAVITLAAPASAQVGLGWLGQLGGSCWQGTDAAGAAIDRQCFQVQFSGVLRDTITRGSTQSSTAFGWNRARSRWEMYAWGNTGAPAAYAPSFDGRTMTLDDAHGRVVWRGVDENNFEIATQTRSSGNWSDQSVIHYRRDGAAPAAFSATASTTMRGHAQMGWIERLAGHCYHQIEPSVAANLRGCIAWEYGNVLHQSWYWGSSAPSGETVFFRVPQGIKFFYWDAQGNFGVGDSSWSGRTLFSTQDANRSRRTSLRQMSFGFSTTTEVRGTTGWEIDHVIRLAHD